MEFKPCCEAHQNFLGQHPEETAILTEAYQSEALDGRPLLDPGCYEGAVQKLLAGKLGPEEAVELWRCVCRGFWHAWDLSLRKDPSKPYYVDVGFHSGEQATQSG